MSADPEITFLDDAGFAAAIPRLCELFQRAFGRPIAPEFLEWRYLRNPVRGMLAAVAISGDDIVASYSASPVSLRNGDTSIRAALSMTTMTDPRFAGRGLFTTLASKVYARMAEESYAAIIGFPNTNSFAPFVTKLEWVPIHEIPTLTAEVTGRAAPALSAEVRRDDGFTSTGYGEAVNDGLFATDRTREYLRWRYAEHPSNKYRVYSIASERGASYCALKSYGHDIDVVDFQSRDAASTSLLLAAVFADAAEAGSKRINAWAPSHHALHYAMLKAGFSNDQPVTYFGARQLGAPSRSMLGYRDWYVQMGDSDVY